MIHTFVLKRATGFANNASCLLLTIYLYIDKINEINTYKRLAQQANTSHFILYAALHNSSPLCAATSYHHKRKTVTEMVRTQHTYIRIHY